MAPITILPVNSKLGPTAGRGSDSRKGIITPSRMPLFDVKVAALVAINGSVPTSESGVMTTFMRLSGLLRGVMA